MEPTSGKPQDQSYRQEIKESLQGIKKHVKMLASGVKRGITEQLSPVEQRCIQAMQKAKNSVVTGARERSQALSNRASQALGELKNVAGNVERAGSEALGIKSPSRMNYEKFSKDFDDFKAMKDQLDEVIAEKRKTVTELGVSGYTPENLQKYYEFLSLQPTSHELKQAYASAEKAQENLQKLIEGKKNIKEKLTENREQKEKEVEKGLGELKQRLEQLEKAIEDSSKATGVTVQRPVRPPEKKGLISEAKDAAIRLSQKATESPVGIFAKRLSEKIVTKAEDLIAEQKEKKQLSDFLHRCDAKIKELEANIQNKPAIKVMRENVGQVYHQILTKSQQDDPQIGRLFQAFNEHPSKKNFENLMIVLNEKTNYHFAAGLKMLFQGDKKTETAIREFGNTSNDLKEVDVLKDKKVNAEKAFEKLQNIHDKYRREESKYQAYQAQENKTTPEFNRINEQLKGFSQELFNAQEEFYRATK